MLSLFLWAAIGLLPQPIKAVNFPFEEIQLSAADVVTNPSVEFGDASHVTDPSRPACKAFPGSQDWPTDEEWSALNGTIDGVLLKPLPVASVCYAGQVYDATRCRYLTSSMSGLRRAYIDDPLTVLTQWPQGVTCPASLNPDGNCTQGGFPVYVANVTTVKHIQATVNFARNKNVRLVIKNTGHDFGGRNTGAGALSIWTHYLKNFEFLPNYVMGNYSGVAVRFGSGLETQELYSYMALHNITVVAAGIGTVGANGGWFGYGGHGNLVSYYGLGSDQGLSLEVVTADGRLLTADPFTNPDLFYALRGGGAGTFGIVTSVVMKAYPPIYTISQSVNFGLGSGGLPGFNFTNGGNSTGSGNTSFSPAAPTALTDPEVFWRGIDMYYKFNKKVAEAGGIAFSYIYPLANNSLTFIGANTFPAKSAAQVSTLMQPLYSELNSIGINVTIPTTLRPNLFGSRRGQSGESPSNTRYRSRFFPRENWDDADLWNRTIAAVRLAVEEGGYTFHGNSHAATAEVAGWPGRDSAVNPAWRKSIMHAMLMGEQPLSMSASEAVAEQDRIQKYMSVWRQLTPSSGSYMNEGDPQEPNWQQTFFGENYPKLLAIKQARDPWGLFWAPTTVGSEAWEVLTADGYPGSQNCRLCRVTR
ncbi:hypothetical protein GE09DRAFT_519178 [Coniochaeta sp. 2T2.1]|nr:hypothetical protein GE09DRAFT_519178 [Coniochaeta sp. 2T2.1]